MAVSPRLLRQGAEGSAAYREGATHVGHYLAEALLERGVDVVTAEDTRAILAEVERTLDFHRDAARLARHAGRRLGVEALLLVELREWSSAASGPQRPAPAAVAFRATLHRGSDGRLLWSGEFSERQASFFASPWRALRYPGRGTRWLSPTELARWGSRRLADQMPAGATEL